MKTAGPGRDEMNSKDTVEHRVEILECQVKSLRNRTRDTWQLLDVLATPPWRRLKFFLQGFRLWKVGRWYGKE